MPASDTEWRYAPSFDAVRRAKLEMASSFEEITEQIVASANVKHYKVCRGKTGSLTQCQRPEFRVALASEIVDLFFNGPAGYRAQYLADPDEGQKQNSRLIASLLERCIAYAEANPQKRAMASERIRLALSACSAKVWLPESSFQFNHELIEEIIPLRWHRNALAAIESYSKREYPNPQEREKAIWGIRAPYASCLEIKGAFLTDGGEELVSPDKISRRIDINRYGYA